MSVKRGIPVSHYTRTRKKVYGWSRAFAGYADLAVPVLWIKSPDGSILFCNPAVESLSKYRRKDLKDIPVTTLFPFELSENADLYRTLKRRHRSGCRHPVYAVLLTRDGEQRFIHLLLDYPQNTRITSQLIRIVIIDTDECRWERERAKNTRAKSTLLHGITCKDISDRFFTLQCNVALLKEIIPPDRLPQYTPWLKCLTDDMNTIAKLLDLLPVLERGEERHPRWLNIEQSIRENFDCHLYFIPEIPGLEVHADPIVKIVFFILAENAVRHGGGGITEFRATYRCSDTGVILTLQDNGVGIQPERKELIFKQGSGSHMAYGLHFVRQILKLCNMTIHETGTFGSGAAFEIHIPQGLFRIAEYPMPDEP